jgi:Spy/CpxP family protein refolding chaperone
MKMRDVLLTACLAGALALPAGATQNEPSTAPSAVAKTDTGQRYHGLADLGLTPNQKDQMKALRKDGQDKMKADFESMKALRQKIKDEFLKATPDPAALDGYADQMAQFHKQMVKNRFANLFKAKQILTQDQFKKFLDLQQQQWGKKGFQKKWNHGDKNQD